MTDLRLLDSIRAATRTMERAIIDIRLRLAMDRLGETIGVRLQRRYNPNWASQPRVPRGNPDGGRWTDGGAAEANAPVPPVIFVSDEFPDPPEVPPKRPAASKPRNETIKNTARWARRLRRFGGPVGAFLSYLDETWLSTDLNEIEAYMDDPRTLEDLQRDAKFPKKGYQVHHIVEQTPARQDGFPKSLIDSPENKVRIPTLIHREITNWYATGNDSFGGLSPRNYLRGKPWRERYDLGLEMLREFGALKR